MPSWFLQEGAASCSALHGCNLQNEVDLSSDGILMEEGGSALRCGRKVWEREALGRAQSPGFAATQMLLYIGHLDGRGAILRAEGRLLKHLL